MKVAFVSAAKSLQITKDCFKIWVNMGRYELVLGVTGSVILTQYAPVCTLLLLLFPGKRKNLRHPRELARVEIPCCENGKEGKEERREREREEEEGVLQRRSNREREAEAAAASRTETSKKKGRNAREVGENCCSFYVLFSPQTLHE